MCKGIPNYIYHRDRRAAMDVVFIMVRFIFSVRNTHSCTHASCSSGDVHRAEISSLHLDVVFPPHMHSLFMLSVSTSARQIDRTEINGCAARCGASRRRAAACLPSYLLPGFSSLKVSDRLDIVPWWLSVNLRACRESKSPLL